jgi:hypothetical protein
MVCFRLKRQEGLILQLFFLIREEDGRLYKAFAGNCQPRGIIPHQKPRNSASSSLEIESAGYADMARDARMAV